MPAPESEGDRGKATGARRNGRGQLSSIDLLPEQADEAIAWANDKLQDRDMPQQEILRQFNAMLADLGIAPITRSAFSRHSVRLAIEMRQMEANRRLTEIVMARLKPGERSEAMIAATELVKWRLLELVRNSEDDPKLLLNTTLAFQRLSATVAREAEIQRRERQDQRDQEKEAADKATKERADAEAATKVEKIAEEAGLGPDRIAAIRRGVLGLSA